MTMSISNKSEDKKAERTFAAHTFGPLAVSPSQHTVSQGAAAKPSGSDVLAF